MKKKPIIAVFEYGMPDLKEFDENEIEYQDWNFNDEYEVRVPLDDLSEKQKNLVLSWCSGSTIEYIQKSKPNYVFFWK